LITRFDDIKIADTLPIELSCHMAEGYVGLLYDIDLYLLLGEMRTPTRSIPQTEMAACVTSSRKLVGLVLKDWSGR